jgi:hypothetical protein
MFLVAVASFANLVSIVLLFLVIYYSVEGD